MSRRPTIAITAGDPCGIGPEVVLKALRSASRLGAAHWLVIGDHRVFEQTAARLRTTLPPWRILRSGEGCDSGHRPVFIDHGHRNPFPPGRPSLQAGTAALRYLAHAAALCRSHGIHALVTAPVTKWAAARADPCFVGQTEYLAQALGARQVAMMFVSDSLRVVLATRHIPLQDVPRRMTPRLLRTTIRLTAEALRGHFRIRRPRVALCGLNPHAGEEGRCGTEERRVMRPLLRALAAGGIRCDGPFSADGLFANPGSYDAVVCCYHDQGLIPFKMSARDRGCQLSVGLPIVRTSPDHGSALDIAGRGIAHPGSMIYALDLAVALARRNRPHAA